MTETVIVTFAPQSEPGTITETLLSRGYRVVATGPHLPTLFEAVRLVGGGLRSIVVADPEELPRVVEQTVKRYGSVIAIVDGSVSAGEGISRRRRSQTLAQDNETTATAVVFNSLDAA
ncbi:hypothetical protein [Williamsia sp. CHRR-6]|uniref:hypothetical protein n=1 Tax=Williamsia sp. CHRR-6 TaxID=2835871 RepID=UPI001BDB120B|nr:hypothetical protein [Williamsia sp. CHRR-6]MBT0566708.1 hypothetical protein [Williamsia sp. CHRR-6]